MIMESIYSISKADKRIFKYIKYFINFILIYIYFLDNLKQLKFPLNHTRFHKVLSWVENCLEKTVFKYEKN